MNAHKLYAALFGFRGVSVAVCLAFGLALLEATARANTVGIFDPAILSTTDGRQIFEQICQGCHMPGGEGAIGAGHYPALANNRTLRSRQYVALTILAGRRNMPAFGARHAVGFGFPPATLSDEQIAAVINYVRTHFGNRYTDPITPMEVRALDQGLR